ncbi:RNA polymerase subunit sigma-24 [Chitinophagaceae bacterium IBVUCB2]|nr:RNA polymerase subunit sigma-24 [Chitinophagaceae bacterium IBVUCB2]
MELTAPLYYDELVAKCKQGDAQSYNALYKGYAMAMFNTSLRIVNNSTDAEDVLQEAFVAAFRLDNFDYSSTFGAWLKRIVINKSIDVLRRRKLTVIDIDNAGVNGFQEEEIPDEENIKLKVEEIKKAIIKLPSGYRTVLSLFLFEDYSYSEIASALNITESTVRTQYYRARQKLLHTLKNGGKDE